MKLVDQNVPAELYRAYERSLGFAQESHEGSGIFFIKKKLPWRYPVRRSNSKFPPSAAQLEVRAAFKKCVDCFNGSPKTGGVEPPAIGYRSREWWFAQAGQSTWPDYLGMKKNTWDGDAADPYQLKDIDDIYHDANWFLKTDEQDFIDFYDEMKIKYGYPWSPSNSPDQIVTKMNQIICDEIDYEPEEDPDICFTPGQTAKKRRGVCDDQSALHYALTWKALKEQAWTDEQINARLGCVINTRADNGHVYNWWKTKYGSTKIIENTYDPGESPKVMGDMKYWGDDKSAFLVQRFDKGGHWEPTFTGNGVIYPLWYYNYFISVTFPIFYAGTIPDWCGLVVPLERIDDGQYKFVETDNFSSWDQAWDAAWSAYPSASWVNYPYEMQNLLIRGKGYYTPGPGFSAEINCDKGTLVFDPSLHTTEAKWAEVDTVKVVFDTEFHSIPHAVCAIRCVETDETQDHASGKTTFYIPKNIAIFGEFSLTFETLPTTKEGLKPYQPMPYQASAKGFVSWIDEAKLYCVGEGIY